MTRKQHNIFFSTILGVCLSLIFILDPPIRNYIPIVWGLIGFGFYAFLLWNSWIIFSAKLLNEHKREIIGLGISYHDSQSSKTVDIIALIQNRNEIKNLSSDIKLKMTYLLTFLRLTVIAFPMIALQGILTVVMTWK